MIWRRLKKPTREQEEEFRERMSDDKITAKDRFAMALSAFLVIVLPCLAVLVAFGLLILFLFGAL
jgi:cell division septal protein FtsQ